MRCDYEKDENCDDGSSMQLLIVLEHKDPATMLMTLHCSNLHQGDTKDQTSKKRQMTVSMQ